MVVQQALLDLQAVCQISINLKTTPKRKKQPRNRLKRSKGKRRAHVQNTDKVRFSKQGLETS